MITQKNYFAQVKQIGIDKLPEELKKAHHVIAAKTDNGRDWSICKKDKEIKKICDLAFEKLGEFIKSKGNLSGTGAHLTPRAVAKKFIKPYILGDDTMWSLPTAPELSAKEQDYSVHLDKAKEEIVVTKIYGVDVHHVFKLMDLWNEIIAEFSKEKFGTQAQVDPQGEKRRKKRKKIYHKFAEEVKYIKVLLGWRNMLVTKAMILNLIEELQTAIINRKIRKTSVFAKEISYIQSSLLKIYNGMKKHFTKFKMKEGTVLMLKEAIKKSKRYDEPAPDKSHPKKINKISLRGLGNIPALTEDRTVQQKSLMRSTDFADMKFNTIGFTGKWLELIGDPCRGFTAMIFGKPKLGKSYLAIDMAGYLARNHGKVLYVAKEEKLDATLQKKLNDKNVAHVNLFVSDHLPEDLSTYDFVFLDSVNKLGLTTKDLENLKARNPGKCFIHIFQTTKMGLFRGKNEFQHDVDVVIEVPEKGMAVQFGRFNQGGKMNIFDNESKNEKPVSEPLIEGHEELSGVKKTKAKISPKIEIETEFGLPLEELAIEFFKNKKELYPSILDMLDNDSDKVVPAIKSIIESEIKQAKADVTVEGVEFSEMDSANLSHGAAYFNVSLKGTSRELGKVAGDDKLLLYEW